METSQPKGNEATASETEVTAISRLLLDLYVVEAVYRHEERLIFSISHRYERVRSEKLLADRLRSAGYNFSLNTSVTGPLILSIDPRRHLRIPTLNVVLFLLTLLSIYIVPVMYPRLLEMEAAQSASGSGAGGWLSMVAELFSAAWALTLRDLATGKGLEFTIAMVSILLVHEMGHFIASRRRGIAVSWPYFIPAPNLIGTFGAVIKSKSPFWNRRDLIEVGAAGPIAGWFMAIGWLIYGLSQSGYLSMGSLNGVISGFSLEGESLLVKALVPMIIGTAPDGYMFHFSEAAFAGWVGLLVTAINMLPIGQLDGGHILYGLIRKRQRVFGWLAVAMLLILGTQSAMWWLFAAFGLFFGVAHPPTIQDQVEPSRISKIMGVVALIILVLSFTPVPFRN